MSRSIPRRRIAGRCTAVLLAAPLALAALPAAADEGRFSVGALAGTLGLGAEVGYRFHERFGARLGASLYEFDRSDTISDVDYDGTLDLQSYGLNLDLYPFGGGFRVSGGLRSGATEVRLVSTPRSNVQIGDVVLTPAQVGTLSTTVETDDVIPTLTIGWGGRIATGFTVGVDVGVAFQGSPTVGPLVATGPIASVPQLQPELEQERREIQEDVEDYDLWPVVQLSFSWRF